MIIFCKDCKWRRASVFETRLDKCAEKSNLNYVTGKIKLDVYCHQKNWKGKCEDFERKPPNRILQFITEAWNHLGGK